MDGGTGHRPYRNVHGGNPAVHPRRHEPEPDFALSESPRYVGRAVAAMAADPDRARWNQRSVNSGQLGRDYGFTDIDGSQPDVWRYMVDVGEAGLEADYDDFR